MKWGDGYFVKKWTFPSQKEGKRGIGKRRGRQGSEGRGGTRPLKIFWPRTAPGMTLPTHSEWPIGGSFVRQ